MTELEQLALDPFVSQLLLSVASRPISAVVSADPRASCPVRAGPLAGDQAMPLLVGCELSFRDRQPWA